MRLILLLLVVGFVALGCCEEDDKPILACYKGAFSKSDGTRFGYLELVSAQSCFTYFSTDCSIVLHNENIADADFSYFFKDDDESDYLPVFIDANYDENSHKSKSSVVECNSDGCNYNIKSQLEKLQEKNNTLYEECLDKYTELAKQERQSSSIFCYGGTFSDKTGDIKSHDLKIFPYDQKCNTTFYSDCSIGLRGEISDLDIIGLFLLNQEKDVTWITCNSDGCNYNLASMMSKLEKMNVTLYNECNKTYEKVIKDYKPAPILTSNLKCANDYYPKKSGDSAWKPFGIAESRPYCGIEFTEGNCLSFYSYSHATISTLNTCVTTNEGKAISCFCTSGDFCNTDIEKWIAEARNLKGSDFMGKCNYTGYNFPQPWRFTTTTKATTIEATTIVPTIATTASKPSQNQPPASNSVPLSTAFVLLLLVA